MNYKDLFQQVVALLSAPGKAWDEIAERGRFKEVAPAFVYPLVGLCGLSTFIGAFVGKGMNADVFQVALTQCCAVAVALFGGFFLAAYLMGRLHMRWLRQRVDPDVMLTFVGYSMVVTLVLDIVSGLLSIALLHWILQIYTFVVVYEGGRRLLKVSEDKQTVWTVLATLTILVCPAVIEFLFNRLSVILN